MSRDPGTGDPGAGMPAGLREPRSRSSGFLSTHCPLWLALRPTSSASPMPSVSKDHLPYSWVSPRERFGRRPHVSRRGASQSQIAHLKGNSRPTACPLLLPTSWKVEETAGPAAAILYLAMEGWAIQRREADTWASNDRGAALPALGRDPSPSRERGMNFWVV